MSIIKNTAKKLVKRVLTPQELGDFSRVNLAESDLHGIAADKLIEAKTAIKNPVDHDSRVLADHARDLLVAQAGTSTYTAHCIDVVSQYADPRYFQVMVLGHLLSQDLPVVPKELGQELINKVSDDVVTLALEESNPIKRRAIVRKLIKAEYPELNNEKLSLAIELVLAFHS